MFKREKKHYILICALIMFLFWVPKKVQSFLRSSAVKPVSSVVKKMRKTLPANTSPYAAEVIYRSPSQWNDYFWIKVTPNNKDNIVKNSPVLKDNVLIGLIDYVSKSQARVKLITSANLSISVQLLRGLEAQNYVLEKINELLSFNVIQKDLELKEHLEAARKKVTPSPTSVDIRLGEISGISAPLWRREGKVLIGKSFNTLDKNLLESEFLLSDKNLIQEDDLLITTGLDGVFPKGLKVARVCSVEPQKNGDYYIEFQARSLSQSLDNLREVEVIKPIGFKGDFVLPYEKVD